VVVEDDVVAELLKQEEGVPAPDAVALAAPDGVTKGKIARLGRSAGQNEIAQPRKAHQCVGPRAAGATESAQFRKAPRHQRRACARPQPAPGGDAAGDGEHILGRPANFHAKHIARMIEPERGGAERGGDPPRARFVLRRQRDRGRQAARHIGGETGA
jgi:hypothetical protein